VLRGSAHASGVRNVRRGWERRPEDGSRTLLDSSTCLLHRRGPRRARHRVVISHAASPGVGGLHVRFRHYLPTRTIHRLCIPIPLRLCLTVPSFVHGLGMYISVLGLVYIFLALCVSDRVSCLLDAVHEQCPPCRCCSQNATVARTMCLLHCLNQHLPWFV